MRPSIAGSKLQKGDSARNVLDTSSQSSHFRATGGVDKDRPMEEENKDEVVRGHRKDGSGRRSSQ